MIHCMMHEVLFHNNTILSTPRFMNVSVKFNTKEQKWKKLAKPEVF